MQNHELPNFTERPYINTTYDLSSLYQRYLGIEFPGKALPNYLDPLIAIVAGQTQTQAEIFLANSQPFRDRLSDIAKYSPQQAIAVTYQALLARDPDPDGLTNYQQLLSNTPDIDVVRSSILGSGEYRRHILTQAYQEILARNPDEEGMDLYLQQLASGRLIEDIVNEVKNSPEAKFVTLGSNRVHFQGRPISEVLVEARTTNPSEEIIESLKTKVYQLEEMNADLNGQLYTAQQIQMELLNAYGSQTNELGSAQIELDRVKAEALATQKRLADETARLGNDNLRLRSDVTAKDRDISTLNTRITSLQEARQAAQSQLDIANRRLAQLTHAYNEVAYNRGYGHLVNQVDNLTDENLRLRRTINNLEAQRRAGNSSEQQRLQQEVDSLKRKLAEAQKASGPKQDEIDQFLAVCGLTKRSLEELRERNKEERAEMTGRLRRILAGISHPSGRFPQEETFKKINSFLDDYDPKFDGQDNR